MALTAYCQWEVNAGATGASDNNGGAFDPVSGTPGVDYTQGAGLATIAYTDIVIGATTTQGTSVARPFVANDVGNTIRIASGTGFTVQTVQIMSVSAGTATFDKSLGTTGSTGGTGVLGGSKATIASATSSPAVAGNYVFVHYNSGTTYDITTALSINLGRDGTTGRSFMLVGYDGTSGTRNIYSRPTNRPTVKLTATISFTSAVADNTTLRAFIFDNNSKGTTSFSAGANSYMEFCKVINQSGNYAFAGPYTTECEAACTSSGGGFTAPSLYCKATVASGSAFFDGGHVNAIAVGGGTSAGRGFHMNSGSARLLLINCVAYNLDTGLDAGTVSRDLIAINCIMSTCTTGYKCATTTNYTVRLLGCAHYNCTTSSVFIASETIFNGSGANASLVSCSADPFTNAASGDFTLNSTAGGGASLRGAGFYPIGGSTAIGYPDIGALQHQDSGGSGYPAPLVGSGLVY